MSEESSGRKRRVAIWVDLDWGLKRELEVYAGFQNYADDAGWDCTIDPAVERSLLSGSGEAAYDGVVARVTPEMGEAARKAGVPLVNVWLHSPVEGIPSVVTDFEASGRMAAAHLLGRGFRQFGFLGFQRLKDVTLQLKGYREGLREEGFAVSSYRFPNGLLTGKAIGWEEFVSGMRDWVDTWQPPIGIMVSDDLYCRFLIDVCRSKGLDVPTDVAIVGSDNEVVMCESPAPSLTSIDMGHARKGYRAAAMLERLMDGEAPPKEREWVAPAELVPRQSTDSYAADDVLVARALRFVSENSHRMLKVPDVAAAVAVTRRTLERRFRTCLGRSVAEEMTRFRLSRAKRRLVETDVPLKTVALEAGFSTANHFSKVFSRVEGLSPTAYREQRQQVFMEREG